MISDAHAGLKAAVKAVLPGAGWQRSRVHFARTQTLGSAHSKPINALISTIFAQTSPETVRETYHQVTATVDEATVRATPLSGTQLRSIRARGRSGRSGTNTIDSSGVNPSRCGSAATSSSGE